MMMSDKSLEGPRLLTKNVPAFYKSFDAEGAIEGEGGWKMVPNASNAVYFEDYFDTAGYQLDDLTLSPTLMRLQDPDYYTTSGFAQPDVAAHVLDIISQERLDPEQVRLDWLGQSNVPSMSETEYMPDQILYGRYRFKTQTTSTTFTTILTTLLGGDFGSGSPTSANKLWIYRFYFYISATPSGQFISIPATRFILGAQITKESDLIYLMRQRRSYEQQKRRD